MKNTFVLWKEIIANPFEGYKGVNNNTKLLLPLLTIIVLFVISISMMIPMMLSDSYSDAIVRTQINSMIDKGNEMSLEQQEAMAVQMKSPMVRNIMVVSSFVGGLATFFLITLLITFILKLAVSSIKKEKIKFSLILKIILFASIVTMVQSIVKMGITVTGDWQRVLARVNDSAGLRQALQTPISLAALLDPGTVGDVMYMLVDAITDVFNWIYYIFLYAGLKVVLELEKKHALIITIVVAFFSVAVGLAVTLFT